MKFPWSRGPPVALQLTSPELFIHCLSTDLQYTMTPTQTLRVHRSMIHFSLNRHSFCCSFADTWALGPSGLQVRRDLVWFLWRENSCHTKVRVVLNPVHCLGPLTASGKERKVVKAGCRGGRGILWVYFEPYFAPLPTVPREVMVQEHASLRTFISEIL